MAIYVVEINKWGCRLYSDAGNLLTFVSFCDKNTGVQVICGAGCSLENTVAYKNNIYLASLCRQSKTYDLVLLIVF